MTSPNESDLSDLSDQHVVITGSSGLIGSALTEALLQRGAAVTRMVRREAAASTQPRLTESRWDPTAGDLDIDALAQATAVVNLAGAGLGDKRWSEEYKRTLVSSRVDGTSLLSAALAKVDSGQRFISGSAVGYYGDRGDDIVTEETGPGTGFTAALCVDWEAATWQAEQAGVPVALLRTGIVLTPEGGALGRVLPLAKAGLGGPLGSGRQFWPWITLPDAIGGILHLLTRPDLQGPVNLVGPHPDRQADVMSALGSALHRPALLPAPAIALKVAIGEMTEEILGSRRALPTVLADSGYPFQHADLSAAIAWLTDQD